MNDTELLATLQSLQAESYGFGSGDLAAARAEAIRRYLCEPRGDEVEGRSQVVSTDLRDTVEWIVPQWLRICMSGSEVCRFDAVGPEDEPAAELETAYVNHVMLQRNDALTFLSTWARDALLSKNGYAKAYWHEKSDIRSETYKGLTDDALAMLQADGEVQVANVTSYVNEYGMPVHDVQARRTYPCGYVRVEAVPPEEIKVHKSVRGLDLQEALYIAHSTSKTLSEIRQMGFDVADDIADGDEESDDEIVEARDRWDEGDGSDRIKTVTLTEEHVRLDYDGDGVAELRRIVRIGSTLLANEETDLVPFACITPIVFPHRHIGVGYDDLVEQHAAVKTTLMRQALDNLYLSNNARTAADFERVNIDDLLTSRPGGIIRTKGSPGDVVMPIVTPQTFKSALEGMQWVDAWRENSTGVSAYYQGLNADALNQTATGVNQIMTASQQRVEAVMRSFANGFRDLCYIVHALTLKNATAPEKLKLNNRWVTVDPREWVKRTNLTVSVGLGTGSKDQRVRELGMVWQMQMSALPAGIARPQNLYETGKRVVEELGYRNSDEFFSNPQMMPPQPPPPNPEMLKAQAQMQLKQMELQADVQKFQAEQVLEAQRIQMEAQAKAVEQEAALQVQAANDARDAEREQVRLQMEAQLKQLEAEHKAAIEREKLAMDKWRAELEAKTKIMVAQIAQGERPVGIETEPEPIQIALLSAVQTLGEAVGQMNRPKQIIRDAAGKAVGVTTV